MTSTANKRRTATIRQVKEAIDRIPRENLGFFPTPLYRLDRLSDMLGVNLYIKRDDFTGSNLFGGNKTRKLEFLMGRAKSLACDTVFTYGATQSNHAMQTAWAAAKTGLKAILYLAAVVPPDKSDFKANLLLDRIFGAEIHIIDLLDGESFADAEKRSFIMGAEHCRRLEGKGQCCLDIPMGGADEYGSLGYINAMLEIAQQLESPLLPDSFDYLYHSTGSGGTMAGLMAGCKLLDFDMELHSVTAMGVDTDYADAAARLSNGALALLGDTSPEILRSDITVKAGDFIIDQNHYAPGYECPSDEATSAIKRLASWEGILVDPVYSGKAFAGLLADIASGHIAPGSNVLFLHTGGSTVFFAEKEIIGNFC